MAEAIEEIQLARPRRFRAYPEYRDSGIKWLGEIPIAWGVDRLKRLAAVQLSSVDKKRKEGEDLVRLCNYVDVYYNDVIEPEIDFMEATASPDEIRRFSLIEGDVLVTKDSESWDDIAVPAYVGSGIDGVVCGYHLAHIRPDRLRLSGSYLGRAFSAAGVRDQFRAAATGITRFGLSKRWIDGANFPVPPVAEQKAIASFLDRETAKIDVLVAKKERLIELLQEKRTALITRAVTQGLDPNVPLRDSGVEWLGKIPAHWEVSRLKTVVASIEQGWSPLCDNRQADQEEWGVLKVGCVNGAEFDEREHKALPPGETVRPEYEIRPEDILMSRANTRQLLGSAAVVGSVRPRLLLCDKLYRIRLRGDFMTPPYLIYALSALVSRFQFEREATGASGSMQNIAQDTIQELVLFIPPVEEQRAIVETVDKALKDMTALIAAVELGIERLREFRTALVSAAVTGKIDVWEEAS